ncbi:uncharacterized protein LOC123431623 [Hordeum vulgare subsp. vulgare]|uniref:uncharacterized protein LOC123431623 n=1 Tax=Hordeum vulgare subsp. vulgare TaxID=112509 RepID=UPI001D1A3722|nr:uncharacterized protein LOC123431623 [Hordeum vulgare subsp. vulgare]
MPTLTSPSSTTTSTCRSRMSHCKAGARSSSRASSATIAPFTTWTIPCYRSWTPRRSKLWAWFSDPALIPRVHCLKMINKPLTRGAHPGSDLMGRTGISSCLSRCMTSVSDQCAFSKGIAYHSPSCNVSSPEDPNFLTQAPSGEPHKDLGGHDPYGRRRGIHSTPLQRQAQGQGQDGDDADDKAD